MPTRIEKKQVQAMFSDIAPTYDLLNRTLSFGVDRLWRKRAVASLLRDFQGKEASFLDVATGTADVALEMHTQAGRGARIVGVDFAYPMLARGKAKATARDVPLSLIQGDGLSLPFKDGAFDGVIIAFGLRNFEDREAGLAEMGRVLKEGGRLVVLEFGHPQGLFGLLYAFYFRVLLPVVGRVVSAHRSAYNYLPSTVYEFPEAEQLSAMMRDAGFREVSHRPMTGGIAELHTGVRE
ncbi:MAG: bifunctional demethylmenaquinone methyltransferase/2-methoxy-6-polyprenyl-1,4-benzoquinol methylase UbiE [Nitrospinae bacterium]|nr:bifunctional demethylmenaquinone methyltransferase/2-methoxy-6-polyprenyl-1,4-benzoquinol methylase UbiE [Nitrospinota bacterium]